MYTAQDQDSMEGPPIQLIVLIIVSVVILLLLFQLLPGRPAVSVKPEKQRGDKNPCPLCGTSLDGKEKVKSIVFPGAPDKVMHIFGCPHCYPEGYVRICPSCKGEMQKEGYLLARVFEKPGRTHVHVLGCTECLKRRV